MERDIGDFIREDAENFQFEAERLIESTPLCHPDCGPIVDRRTDGMHAHENQDGRCWHEDGDI